MNYVYDGMSTSDIMVHHKINEITVRNALSGYLVMHPDKKELLDKIRWDRKSKNSKNTRANASPESETKRLQACRAFDYSDRDARMATDRKGVGNPNYGNRNIRPTVKCPHCNKMGDISGMKRWHFDNCKDKV